MLVNCHSFNIQLLHATVLNFILSLNNELPPSLPSFFVVKELSPSQRKWDLFLGITVLVLSEYQLYFYAHA